MSKNDEAIREVADELYKLAEDCGIEFALKMAFGDDVVVNLAVPKDLLDKEIRTYDFPTRTTNVLSKWCKLTPDKPRTVERIVSLINMGDYVKEYVPGYGAKSKSYLKTFLLVESYDRFTEEQRKEFCYSAVLLNCEIGETA